MMAAFNLFASLFQRIDTTTATFVTDVSGKAIVAITPVVTVGLTISFIVYGLLIMRGAIDMPVLDFIGRALRIGIIVSIALAGGLYQTEIAGLIGTATNDLALALIADPGQAENAADLIDGAAESGFTKSGEAAAKGGFLSSDGWAYYLLSGIILFSTGVLVAIGGAFIIIAKVALAVLAGLGPLFIVALLFQPTHRFFDLWIGQVMNYAILSVLFALVFGLLLSIYGNYIADLTFDGQESVWWAAGGALMLSIASMVLILQLPSIASGLAGGVALSYGRELRSMARAAGSVGRGVSSGMKAIGPAFNSPREIGNRLGASAAGRAVAGYFKGKK